MLVFVVCLVEFIVVKQAATSVFFLIMVATLIDVIAGYTIGIRVARRDLNIGGEQLDARLDGSYRIQHIFQRPALCSGRPARDAFAPITATSRAWLAILAYLKFY